VSYLFHRKGVIGFDAEEYSEDAIIEASLEVGAEDVTNEDGQITVLTAPEDFEAVQSALEAKGFKANVAEVGQVPDATLALDEEATRKALRLVEKIDDHEDVQSVATNLDIPEGFEFEEE
jgi:transcriptional/translational regulatory protein YebC/TACO1